MVWSKVVCPGADSVIQTDTVSGRDSMLIRVPSGDMSCPDWLSRDVVPLGFLLIRLLSFVDSPTAAGFGCWPSGGWSEELAAMLLGEEICQLLRFCLNLIRKRNQSFVWALFQLTIS